MESMNYKPRISVALALVTFLALLLLAFGDFILPSEILLSNTDLLITVLVFDGGVILGSLGAWKKISGKK